MLRDGSDRYRLERSAAAGWSIESDRKGRPVPVVHSRCRCIATRNHTANEDSYRHDVFCLFLVSSLAQLSRVAGFALSKTAAAPCLFRAATVRSAPLHRRRSIPLLHPFASTRHRRTSATLVPPVAACSSSPSASSSVRPSPRFSLAALAFSPRLCALPFPSLLDPSAPCAVPEPLHLPNHTRTHNNDRFVHPLVHSSPPWLSHIRCTSTTKTAR